jgi:multimeric flavodoxin WrbA
MKAIAINGSARKNGNTAALLKSALEGASSMGAETKLVNLYDLNFKGCTGCEACKLLNGKYFGHCAQKDDITDLLEECIDADILLFGSPIYFNDVTGELRSFLERYWFPSITYTKERKKLYTKPKRCGWFYTTNAPEGTYTDWFKKQNLTTFFLVGPSEWMVSAETWQFEDYSKYAADMFDVEARWKRHTEVFPEECKKAFEMGRNLATPEYEIKPDMSAAAGMPVPK